MGKYKYTPKQIIHKPHYRFILYGLRNDDMDINGIIDVLKSSGYKKTKCNNVVNMTYILMYANLIIKNTNVNHQRIYSITENGKKLIDAFALECTANAIYKNLTIR